MFTRTAATNARRAIWAARSTTAGSCDPSMKTKKLFLLQKRMMGGGGGYLQVSETHKNWGEFFGVVLWLWVFYRARQDLPVVLGFRHPWEHADDDHGDHGHPSKPDPKALAEKWDKFSDKAMKLSEDDDDDDEEDEEE